MSSHEVFVHCGNCGKAESIYTGDRETEQFDDYDWEGAFITVQYCIECKVVSQTRALNQAQLRDVIEASK